MCVIQINNNILDNNKNYNFGEHVFLLQQKWYSGIAGGQRFLPGAPVSSTGETDISSLM